ncbi:hypothetical protein V5O48_006247 [Marasmius crinis-equi]|uniref:Transmembrane protein n=1 Tax=Marasmius crinis-equi TaxID=585013 RepID=A0ABR3FK11_9AGAR
MLTSLSCLVCVSILAILISRRIPTTWLELKSMTWGKVCLLLVLVDSWLTVLGGALHVAGFVLTGIGTHGSPVACNFVNVACLVLVGNSKVLIYTFLVEKAYIVWSGGLRVPRLKTPVYRICLVFQLGYVAIAALYLEEKTSIILDDGACLLWYKYLVSISVLSFEFIHNLFFTFMFCWPLYNSKIMSPALREVAKKTLVGSLLGWAVLATSALVTIGMSGKQLDWVCMSSCVFDVTLNALILYWVSSGAPSDSVSHFTLPTISLATSTMPGLREEQAENKNSTDSREETETSPLGTASSLEFATIHSQQTLSIDLEPGSGGNSSPPVLRS